MCGRYSLPIKAKELEKRLNAQLLEQFKPRYNAAPSQNLPVVINSDPGSINFFQWGLVPFWANDAQVGNKLINARSETIFEKPSFRESVKKRRCLIPADGFFEWSKKGKLKLPHRIKLKNGEVFMMAGIWDSWQISDEKYLNSFSIITTEANDLISSLHERMPVILKKETERDWLKEGLENVDIQSFMKPYDSNEMEYYLVSNELNNVENDFPELIAPSEGRNPGETLSLFQ